ncbi:hypothetical protein EIP86_009200 [Pleurotus ostreatoroseus]|nr:hypothetical protein EIP86_009200 [Pleurotus ostreatoroseus]
MNIPFIDSHRIVDIDALPVMPFMPLLLLKLQAWEDHRKSTRYDFQAKQYVDVRDIEKLLVIAVQRREHIDKDENVARERVKLFVSVGSASSRERWVRIGFDATIARSVPRTPYAPLASRGFNAYRR